MFRLFIEKDFESKGRKKKERQKGKREGIKLWYMWNILTKDGIYCSYLKWICSSKEKYYKKPGRVFRELQSETAAASKIHLSLLYVYIYIYIHKDGLKRSYDDITTAVDDFLINGTKVLQYRWKKDVCHRQGVFGHKQFYRGWGHMLVWHVCYYCCCFVCNSA